MSDIKVPDGYKQTEVGVIPKDWEVSNIKNISLSPTQNGLFYEPQRKGKGVPLINVSDMYKSAPINVSLLELFDATPNEMSIFKVNSGDLFFTRSSIVPSGIAFCNIFESKRNDVVFDSHLIRVQPNKNLIDSRYLYLNCISQHARTALISEAKTATMTTIDQAAINRCPVLIPPRKEQTAIATALSDVDNLIHSLEKLITKKEAIKTATMQQLLSGKTRLPEFAIRDDGIAKGFKQTELGWIPEDWEVVSLSQLAQIDPENLPSTTPKGYEFKYISLERIDKGVLLDTDSYLFSNAPSRARRVLRHNDVIISTVRPNLMSHYIVKNYPSNLICSTGFSVARSNLDKLVPSFLYQHIFANYINSQINVLITGSNYPAINSRDVRGFLLPLPEVKEQNAIATILSDMDSEIQALQKRLDKTRDIKQGMMQQLLTGKVRLVDSSAKSDTQTLASKGELQA